MRYREKVPLPERLMEQIWNICLQVGELSFYELERPREKLVIFDRYEFVDPDIGIILEPVSLLLICSCNVYLTATALRLQIAITFTASIIIDIDVKKYRYALKY